MSADNYYIVRKHPRGGFTAVMGFASNDNEPEVMETSPQFPTIEAAFLYAGQQSSEYGVFSHPELVSE